MKNHISEEHEVFEVINAFPFLYDSFDRFNIPKENIPEGVSLNHYLIAQKFSNEEKIQIITKLNREVSLYLKKAEKIS